MRRAAIAAALLAAAAAAAREARVAQEVDLFAEREGLVRVVLPVELVAACQPDLSDLRVRGRDGSELPYLLDASPASRAPRIQEGSAPARVLDLHRERTLREGRPVAVLEEYVLEPAEPLPGGREGEDAGGAASWELVVEAPHARFVRRASVAAEGEDPEREPLRSAPLFRVDGAERLRIAAGSGRPGVLRVRIEGEEGFFLEPVFRFESARPAPPRPEAVVPLAILEQRSEAGETVLELERPSGLVPDALRLATDTRAFVRSVVVTRPHGSGAGTTLGAGPLFRFQDVEQLELAIAPAAGDRLHVRIRDDDSPPLARLAVSAVVGRPAVVLPLAPAGDGAPDATLRCGDGPRERPAYDLAAVVALAGRDADVGARLAALREREAPGVRLGPPRALPLADAVPAFAFAMQPGAPLDRAPWRHQRRLVVPSSPDGVTRVALAAEDLAVAREDLGDLRVADTAGRQWPILVEPDAGTQELALSIGAPEREGRETVQRLVSPVAPVAPQALLLDVDATFLDRDFRLFARADGERGELLAAGRLARRAGDASPLRIALPGRRVDELELRITSGDDAPLALQRARAVVATPALLLLAPPGAYVLLLGHAGAEPPHYELASLRGRLLAARSAPVEAGPLEPNPEHRAMASLTAGGRGARLARRGLVWGALVGAVVVLGALTLRTTREGSGGRGAD